MVNLAFAAVPTEYQANYEIQADYDAIINELFVEIQAKSQVGQQIQPSIFADLHKKFLQVFPHLPSQYSYNVIYQQCTDLSFQLSLVYNYNTLVSFMENCFKPLNETIQNINRNYSIKAEGIIAPVSWPAPLTVTLDARSSTDPSNQTIPNENFFRYYRDINGIDQAIGRGQVLSYTFDEPGNYRVHLTVRSSNQKAQGILDGTKIFSVDVSPKSANIVVYANGQKLEKYNKVKVGLQEAQRGLVLDGSATQARGWRQILDHNREIKGPNSIILNKQGFGIPGVLKAVLAEQWEYQVKLSTNDNQNNSVSETFTIVVSDPVAIIKQDQEVVTTANIVGFDASTSYSIISRLRLFTWEIFDEQGNRIRTFQGKSIKKQFPKPWPYTIKLTVEDELGQENVETIQLLVESSAPIPQFTITPRYEWKYPSEFVLDAAATSDLDLINGNDELSYSRNFSNANNANITKTENNNRKITVAFNDIGEHTITLTVSDRYGKVSTIQKNITVESTLRPVINVSPRASQRGEPVTFSVESNQAVVNYTRDFGDGDSTSIQANSINHTYDTVGVYTVKLIARAPNQENELSTQVFIGERNSPIPAYKVIDTTNTILLQNDTCIQTVGNNILTFPGYNISRYQKVNIDTSESVNAAGQEKDLQIYFQPKDGDIINPSNSYSHSFNEVGCQYIDLIVEDTSLNKNSKVRIRFKVYNTLPTLDNILINFPQFGNQEGIGLNENNIDIFSSDYDPLIVKVSASNPRDQDGFISYYQWYYYYKDDPSRILASKISPASVPYTYFSLPRIPGEFAFGVKIFDNDNGSQSSEDIIWLSPIVFFPPDTTKPDIPLVTLRVDKTTVEVGEEVNFEVVSRILSDRPDFESQRVIQYDLDGDGSYDITTKKDKISWIYTKVNEQGITPRASVLYRGYRGVGVGEKIIVQNSLIPRLLFTNKGNIALFRDITAGDFQFQEICLDMRSCAINEDFLVDTGIENGFIFQYPTTGSYMVHMDLIDTNANVANKNRTLTINEISTSNTLELLSIPEASTGIDNTLELFVGNNLNNSILYYFHYKGEGECFIDLDINYDSNQDGQKATDKDLNCNTVSLRSYQASYNPVIGRVIYDDGDSKKSQDFSVNFLDFDIELTIEQQEIHTILTDLIQSIDPAINENQELINLLIRLRNNIIDSTESKGLIVDIQTYLDRYQEQLLLTDKEKQDIQIIINKIKDGATSAALGENNYQQAKANILSILPTNLQVQVENLLTEFEQITGTESIPLRQAQQNILQEILETIGNKVASSDDNIWDEQISPLDMELIIIPNICIIASFYNIPTENCSNEGLRLVPEEINDEITQDNNSGGLWKILKIIFIILGILIGIFVLLVVIFAIRARLKQKQANKEPEEILIPAENIEPKPDTIKSENTNAQASTQETKQEENSDKQNTTQ